MRTLQERAPAKVNLCLFVGPLRDDGRHELVTLFESVSLFDELVVSGSDSADQVVCPGVEGPNLTADALARLRTRGWEAPPVRVEISKRIPIAGGMGGGSADAAALLRIAPQLAPIAEAELLAIAAVLGADVPAQLAPGLTVGTGAGEVVRPVPPLEPHSLAIAPLDQELSTREVYAEADRLGLTRSRDELDARLRELDRALQRGTRLPQSLLVNDLEPAARSLCPAIDGALDTVTETGADAALVCGSGPTVAGVYWGEDGGLRAAQAATDLNERFPKATAVTPVSSQPSGTIRAT